MGERAIAVVRTEGRTERYVSQWGASERVLDRVFAAESPESSLLELRWALVEDHRWMDFQMLDAAYLVTPERFTVFVPLWFGLGITDSDDARDGPADPTRGILVPVRSLRAFRRARDAFREFKGILLDSIDDGSLAPRAADAVLERTFELLDTLQLQFRRVPNLYQR